MTNYEKIKSMTVKEMVDMLCERGGCGFCADEYDANCYRDEANCGDRIKAWLESEAEK